jgi:DHA1 family tetracycline resistance protein-like MFS transporter
LSSSPSVFGRIWVLLLVVFIDMVGFGIMLPYMPFWAEKFGATETAVTALMSIYAFFQFFCAFPLGWISDRWGRKPILALSIFGSVISFSLLAVADSLWMMFLSRGLGGVMGANIAVAMAYVADVTEADERAKGMGLMGAAFGLGFILGPAFGGLLSMGDPAQADHRLAFGIAAGVCAFATVMTLVVLKEPARHKEAIAHGLIARLRTFSEVLRQPLVLLPILIGTIAGVAMAGLEGTYALWVERAHGWGPFEVGLFFAYIGTVLVLVQGGAVGPVAARFGEARMLMAGLIILCLGMALIPPSLSIVMVGISGALVAIGYAFCDPAISSLISRNAPPDRQGAVMGVLQSANSLVRIVGPVFAGALFQFLGRDAPYVSGAIIVALAALLAVRLLRANDRAADAARAQSETPGR